MVLEAELFICFFDPKKEDSSTSKDFRPLSLPGSAYKVLSKVLANKLKMVMHKLVSDYQGAFVKERQILDGVLIAGECIESRLKEKKPGVLCKIDMEKTFDNSTERIKPSKGLIQGDSLSPFLFLLVVEVLSKLLMDAVTRGQLHGFQVKDNGCIISHLQFADDTLLFLDAMWRRLEDYLELGCKVEKFPIKYLGMPIGATSRCASVWDEVI
ncbi:uncharacterized protein LOC113272801 [Papaver somniferum]|uniref:uncharacterized protein LOC113272801 n=1 Tax=Papaver somniferum TaxID=3469 RepID=UPI000E6F908D|nr:uncharacterized protein LOC113272801 [Papaver somniferum]